MVIGPLTKKQKEQWREVLVSPLIMRKLFGDTAMTEKTQAQIDILRAVQLMSCVTSLPRVEEPYITMMELERWIHRLNAQGPVTVVHDEIVFGE